MVLPTETPVTDVAAEEVVSALVTNPHRIRQQDIAREGDTLWTIGSRWGIAPELLKSLNPTVDFTGYLPVGEVIYLEV
jgi:LysM repeat protein